MVDFAPGAATWWSGRNMSEWVSEWVSKFIHSALKAERVTSALQPRQTKMSLKDVWTVRVRRLVVAVWREDCSILSGPPPKSSCLRAECWFAEQWGHRRQPSEDRFGLCAQLGCALYLCLCMCIYYVRYMYVHAYVWHVTYAVYSRADSKSLFRAEDMRWLPCCWTTMWLV